jgi:hypothetical protein
LYVALHPFFHHSLISLPAYGGRGLRMSEIERIIEALTAPSAPVTEVLTIDRLMAERALAWMESHPDIAQGGPSLCEEVCAFRQALVSLP